MKLYRREEFRALLELRCLSEDAKELLRDALKNPLNHANGNLVLGFNEAGQAGIDEAVHNLDFVLCGKDGCFDYLTGITLCEAVQ